MHYFLSISAATANNCVLHPLKITPVQHVQVLSGRQLTLCCSFSMAAVCRHWATARAQKQKQYVRCRETVRREEKRSVVLDRVLKWPIAVPPNMWQRRGGRAAALTSGERDKHAPTLFPHSLTQLLQRLERRAKNQTASLPQTPGIGLRHPSFNHCRI